MNELNKEEIYDAQIAPLMSQILAICQEHKISMLAAFHIPTTSDPDLFCTSALTNYEDSPMRLRRATNIVLDGETTMVSSMIMTVQPGETK